MVERVENLHAVVASIRLEIFRKQVPGPGTLGSREDEGVPVGKLGGLCPLPGLLDQAESGVHGRPVRQVFHNLAGPRWLQAHLPHCIPVELVEDLPAQAPRSR